MKHLGDITKISGREAPIVDCITGGSPCQDLSIAGKRAGLDGERSGLFMEQIRIVKEMRDHDRETNNNGGVDVRPRFMVWENVKGALSSNGGDDFRVVLEETARIADPTAVIPRPPQEKWSNAGCIMGDGWSIAWRLHDAQFWGVAQRRNRIALVADFGGGSAPEVLFERDCMSGNIEQSKKARKDPAYTPRKDAEKSDSHAYGLDRASYNQGKNAKYDFSIDEEKIGAQTAMGPGAVFVIENAPSDSRYKIRDDGVFQTLKSRMGTGGGNTPMVLQSIVRRITPKEAERLQGFPDDWTDIGEWTDSNGKKRKTSDAQRYKALGNSIATPFWFWLLRRISSQYYRPATLASLFDGIGGFPYCWERCNGSGTAIWASEIEDFPIAVTKKHFPEGGEVKWQT